MDDATVIVGDFHYRDLIRRRNQMPEERWFSEQAPFRLLAAPAAEHPVAMSCQTDRGVETFRLDRGGYLARMGTPAEITSVFPGRHCIPCPHPHFAFPHGRARLRNDYENKLWQPNERAKVVSSARAAGLAEAHAKAAAARLIDGVVWAPVPQPVLTFDPDKVEGEHIRIRYASTPSNRLPLFHVEDTDAAVAHAEWHATRPWRAASGPAPAVAPPAEARIVTAPDRGQFLLLAARATMTYLGGLDWPGDFARLNLGMLEGWVRFRRHAAAVEAGDVAAVRPAFEALCDILDRTPERDVVRGENETAARRLRRELEGPVRHWRTYLGGMAPMPEEIEDMDSVSSLAR